MTEAEITPKILALAKQVLIGSCALEIKLSKNGSIPFSSVVEHQVQGLLHAKHQKLIFKIPDMGSRNPFDAFMLHNAGGYVVCVFYEPRVAKTVVFIDIDDWIAIREGCDRKSLTLERAKDAGIVHTL